VCQVFVVWVRAQWIPGSCACAACAWACVDLAHHPR
jgi:hypothetical protein